MKNLEQKGVAAMLSKLVLRISRDLELISIPQDKQIPENNHDGLD